jgi:hypothetical protein
LEAACYGSPNGRMVTPSQFLAMAGPDYRARGIHAYCPECGEQVDPYGLHSTQVTARFDHPNISPATDPFDDCTRANRTDPRYRGLRPREGSPDDAERLRAEFFTHDNVTTAYAFVKAMCGRNCRVPLQDFAKLIRRADRRRIWHYVDLPLWCVAPILLTLSDFDVRTRVGMAKIHFTFDKPRGADEVIWLQPEECSLKKVYADSGRMVEMAGNPWAMSEASYNAIGGNKEWIGDGLANGLIGLGRR